MGAAAPGCPSSVARPGIQQQRNATPFTLQSIARHDNIDEIAQAVETSVPNKLGY